MTTCKPKQMKLCGKDECKICFERVVFHAHKSHFKNTINGFIFGIFISEILFKEYFCFISRKKVWLKFAYYF